MGVIFVEEKISSGRLHRLVLSDRHTGSVIDMVEVGGCYTADPYECFCCDSGVIVQYDFSVLVIYNPLVEYNIHPHFFQELFSVGRSLG